VRWSHGDYLFINSPVLWPRHTAVEKLCDIIRIRLPVSQLGSAKAGRSSLMSIAGTSSSNYLVDEGVIKVDSYRPCSRASLACGQLKER